MRLITDAHNVPLSIAAQSGIFGLVPFVLIVIEVIRRALPFDLSRDNALRTALLHVGNSSIRIFHRMTNAVTGELVATLEQAGVHLDLDARRPAPLPPALRERAQKLLARR